MAKIPNLDSTQGPSSVEPNNTQKHFEQLCDRLRQIWIEEYRKSILRRTGRISAYDPGPFLDGGRDAIGKRYQPVWPKVAKFALSHKINPIYFIRAQFQTKGEPPRSPALFLNNTGLSRYKTFIEKREDIEYLRLSKESQIRTAQSAVEAVKTLYGHNLQLVYRIVIADPDLSLSALFRYLLSVSAGFEDLSKIYYNIALQQYLYEKEAYDEVWGDLIVPALKQEADSILDSLIPLTHKKMTCDSE